MPEQPKEAKPEDDGKDYVYSPYYGFIPADKVMTKEAEDKEASEEKKPMAYGPAFYFRNKMASGMKFRFVPGYGFVPKEEEKEEEMKAETRKKRAADEDEAETVEVKEVKQALEKSQELFNPLYTKPFDMKYQFHPYHGFVPVPMEGEKKEMMEEEEKLFKYVPFYGFVPVEEKKEGEEKEEEKKEEEEEILYKYNPFYGFVQVKEGEEESAPKHPLEEQEYEYHPYLGFIPVKAKMDDEAQKEDAEATEEKQMKKYKFHPYYGFVEIKDEDKDEEKKPEPLYKFVPYYGFVPANEKSDDDKEEAMEEEEKKHHISYSFHPYYGYLPTVVKSGEEKKEQLYKHDPFLGFVPVKDEAEEEAQEGDARKKREAQTFIYPQMAGQYITVYPTYQPLAFQQVQVLRQEDQAEDNGTPASTKPLEHAGNVPVILPGPQPVLVPGILIPQLPVVLPGQSLPLPENQFPVIPNEPDSDEQGADEF